MVSEVAWIQCEEILCRKWRILPSGINADDLPDQWFCHMKPFVGNCEMPEEGEMPANNFTVAREISPVADTVDNAQISDYSTASSSKAIGNKSMFLQKSITNYFPIVKHDEAMQALRRTAMNNDESNTATMVVNIVTAGFSRPRSRKR